MKKLIAMIVTISTLVCALGAFGVIASDTPGGTPIRTVEEFLAMSDNGVYYLANDLDFSGKTYSSTVYSKTFRGVFDGNGHALLGITVSGKNSDAGVFGNMFSGTIKNLTLGKEDQPIRVSSTGAQYSVAAIAGTMTNGATLENVTIYGDIKGDGKTSGITSYVHTGKVVVNGCKVYGRIQGNPASGFFALSNDGSSEITITNSFNYATVKGGGSSAGGFYTVVGSTGGSRSGSLTITGSANFGSIEASDWRAGGIVGEFNENSASKLTVDFCYNMGSITMTGAGGFAAGIVGGACFNAPSGARKISNVYNGGDVKNTANANNTYQLVYAAKSNSTVSLKNAVYLTGNPTENVKCENVVTASTVDELTALVKAYPASVDGNAFVGATAGVNLGYPILNHEAVMHETVETFACGRKVCLDCGKTVSEPDEETHRYHRETVAPVGYLNGYTVATCSACQHVEIESGTPSVYTPKMVEGVYQIASVDHLTWYSANLAQGLLTGRESLKLTADLDLEDRAFEPIGTETHPFGGHFDGGRHTLSHLKVNSKAEGGLFGVLSLGASITSLVINDAEIEAAGDAGALFGSIGLRAIVKIEWIIVNRTKVTSTSGNAGALGGSTDRGMNTTISQAVVNMATVKGQYAGGIVGLGNSLEVNTCFVNATMTGKNQSVTGALAYYTNDFTQKNSGYVKTGSIAKENGVKLAEDSFTDGKVAYLVNTYANRRLVGVENDTVIFGNPIYGVRVGRKLFFTTKCLSDTGDLEVYTDGKVVAIAVKRNEGPKLTDLTITLTADGKAIEVKVAELMLVRHVTLNDQLYAVDMDTALYTLPLAGVTSYVIGSYSGTAVIESVTR